MKKYALVLVLLLGEALIFLAFALFGAAGAGGSPSSSAVVGSLFALELWSAFLALLLIPREQGAAAAAPAQDSHGGAEIAHELKSATAALRTAKITEQTLSQEGKELIELAIGRLTSLTERLDR